MIEPFIYLLHGHVILPCPQRARLLHVGMIVTIQLVIYDFVKQLVGLPATGAH
jgi:hypothetical protein